MLEDLRAEYLAQTMGPLITERVRGLVSDMLRHRDPETYARGAYDYRDGLYDVLQDFTIDVLLHEGQLAYIFDNTVDVDGFDRLINFQLRRYLARTRERTIVDNLIERSIRLLRDDELVATQGEGGRLSFSMTNCPRDPGPTTVAHAAAVAGNAVPKIYSNPDERNPKVYADDGLRTLLRVFLCELGSPVRRSELQILFELLLTPWITSVLGLDEAVGYEHPELTPEEQMMVDVVATRVTESWSERDAVVFRYKLGNLSDAQLGERLEVSRPTAANLKDDLFAALAQELSELDEHLRLAVITAIANLAIEVSS